MHLTQGEKGRSRRMTEDTRRPLMRHSMSLYIPHTTEDNEKVRRRQGTVAGHNKGYADVTDGRRAVTTRRMESRGARSAAASGHAELRKGPGRSAHHISTGDSTHRRRITDGQLM